MTQIPFERYGGSVHPVQQHILKELTVGESLSYSQLKPKSVESNRFTYHLNTLMRQGYIGKRSKGYQLTAPGKRYVDKMSLKSFYPRSQPKIVTVIICEKSDSEALVYRRKQQPFWGRYVFPYGKIHFGETVVQAATRELEEKTGLRASLVHRGDAYLAARERGELVSHMLCHVFLASSFSGTLTPHPLTNEMGWKKIISIPTKNFFPGFLELWKLVKKSKKHFFAELPLQ